MLIFLTSRIFFPRNRIAISEIGYIGYNISKLTIKPLSIIRLYNIIKRLQLGYNLVTCNRSKKITKVTLFEGDVTLCNPM